MKLSMCALAVGGIGASCLGQSWTFTINAAQEVPTNASPGTGTGTVTYLPATNVLTWHLEWANLMGVPIAMHFHTGAPGVNGAPGVMVMDFTPATSGMAMGAEPNVSGGFVEALMAGNTYINIHTTAFPGGEIRGQVVPAPAAAGLLALGAAVVGRRRR